MADRLKGKLAFCTASGAGIGRATAIAFAREGARVVATDIDEAALADLKAAGVAECVRLDARDAKAIEAGNFGVLRANAERIVANVRAARNG